MKAKRTHDVVATIGTYKDRDGNEKKRYHTCGSAFTGEDGRVSIKLDSVPVGPEWSGWFSLFDVKERDNQPPAGSYANAAAVSAASGGDEDLSF